MLYQEHDIEKLKHTNYNIMPEETETETTIRIYFDFCKGEQVTGWACYLVQGKTLLKQLSGYYQGYTPHMELTPFLDILNAIPEEVKLIDFYSISDYVHRVIDGCVVPKKYKDIQERLQQVTQRYSIRYCMRTGNWGDKWHNQCKAEAKELSLHIPEEKEGVCRAET